MADHITTIDLGDRQADLHVRVNRRAKRLILKVDTLSGRVLATAPSRAAVKDAVAFAGARKDWLRAQLNKSPAPRPFTPGAIFPYRGEDHLIVHDGPPRARLKITATEDATPNQLIVGGEPAHLNRRVCDWLKREARARLAERADHYAERLGVRRGKISVRDQRSRWGSCSAKGDLSFSWRLILAPDWVLDYVAAHECAHLIHLNHSPDYWALLASLDVDADAARDWFRQEGAGLYTYGANTGATTDG